MIKTQKGETIEVTCKDFNIKYTGKKEEVLEMAKKEVELKSLVTPILERSPYFNSEYFAGFIEEVNKLGYDIFVPIPELGKRYRKLKVSPEGIVMGVCTSREYPISYKCRMDIWEYILNYNYKLHEL